MKKYDFACNLWAFYDLTNRAIYSVAGRVYSLPVNKEQQFNMLKKLAEFDHYTVAQQELEDHYSIVQPDGSQFERAARLDAMQDPNLGLFLGVLHRLNNSLPSLDDYSNPNVPKRIKQELPHNLLCIPTLVCEDAYGNRKAILTEEDNRWFQAQLTGENTEPTLRDEQTEEYLRLQIDMLKATNENNIIQSPPESFDLCQKSLETERFLVDGALIGHRAWAFMCTSCFGENGKGIGWGKGQLFSQTKPGEWLQVAGFRDENEAL